MNNNKKILKYSNLRTFIMLARSIRGSINTSINSDEPTSCGMERYPRVGVGSAPEHCPLVEYGDGSVLIDSKGLSDIRTHILALSSVT